MSPPGPLFPKSAIKVALARAAYARGEVRVADGDVRGFTWLVASPQGVFAVRREGVKPALFGHFFGICRDGDQFYLFERCAPRGEAEPLGRLLRLTIADGMLTAPAVLATGLDNGCHQVRVIDGAICVVDTGNQAIRRFALDGREIDVQRPLPPGIPGNRSGAYCHINAIAAIGDRLAIMLHNGSILPEKHSELAWLRRDWTLIGRESVPGHSCHDIVADERGVLWHSASMSGEIISSEGVRVKIADDLMTRGICFTPDAVIVGKSTFGPRHTRDRLRGAVVILDRAFNRIADLELRGAPTDIVAL